MRSSLVMLCLACAAPEPEPQDGGAPPPDAGEPSHDAGLPPDAGSSRDAGAAHDAGQPDAGGDVDGGWYFGNWSHHGNIVLSGTGFGTRPAFSDGGFINRAWDDCSHDDPLTVWDDVSPKYPRDTTEQDYAMRCRAPDEVTALKLSGAASDTPHPRIERYLTGGGWNTTGAANEGVVAHDTEVSPYLYASFYYRADSDWHQNASTDGVHFMYVYDAANTVYTTAGFYYFAFTGFQNPLGGIALGPNYFVAPTLFSACPAPQGDIRCVDPTLVHWYATACGGVGAVGSTACGGLFPRYTHPVHPRREWIKLEYVFKHGDPDAGVHDVFMDNHHSWHAELNDEALPVSGPRSEMLGGHFRDYGTDPEFKNNWGYFSNVYLDLSWARVVIADASRYDSATLVEPQPLVAWSDHRIALQVNLGRLVSGSQAWVFVFDAQNHLVSGGPLGSFTVP